ncbi:MAG: biotin-dependent carboxyltransferase family protein [Actinomycetota bacterium]|nr:biotin-dependent carboxyltransferase family protein [Actinomycetota bacterium]
MSDPTRRLHVVTAGPQTTVQDLGRPGYANLGVPRSGALDQPAHRLANRMVGNRESAATLECLLGGLAVRTNHAGTVAVTGARVPVQVNGRPGAWGSALSVPAGARLQLGQVTSGLRAYVAVAGGIDVPEVLGSRSTDLLSGLGPAVLADDDVLPVGASRGRPGEGEAVTGPPGDFVLRVRLGPREDWFSPNSLAALDGASYEATEESNRIGLRLKGEPLARSRDDELPSEGMVLGAVQVRPNGQPMVFLNDHPVTGGYPVVGVVLEEDLPVCAQLRPGQSVRLRILD